MDRLGELSQFYREDPDDPLNLYLLALEYRNTDPDRSVTLFLELIATHPSYLPAYYTTAEILYSEDRLDEAGKILTKGIALARHTGQQKALGELQNLKSELESE
jgi:tetratricopeptide (TPR) repeat protein